MKEYRLTDWLPTTRREMELRGWDEVDVVLMSADAYVDHPSFGAAVIGRVLEDLGLRVAIVPQPNWRDDLRDFKKMGRPRLFFGISPGCMDSMVNKYTAARRLRSDDAYTPDARSDMRPEYPTIVYTQILKRLWPDVPVVLGGIEASMRRLTHYDYWQDRLRPCILVDSGADALMYGMGEQPMTELARRLIRLSRLDRRIVRTGQSGQIGRTGQSGQSGQTGGNDGIDGTVRNEGNEEIDQIKEIDRTGRPITAAELRQVVTDIPQMVYLADGDFVPASGDIVLHSHEDCLRDKRKQAANFRHIEEESNRYAASRMVQRTGSRTVVVNPPYPTMTTAELDHVYDLPYTRLPHPKYKGKRIPAYDMIKFSVNIHRGCFGGCAFCTISAHQGKFIVSRSQESILREVRALTELPDWRGNLSDLGGPSANMYRMGGRDERVCRRCVRPSCIHPKVCPNLNADHGPLLALYRAVDALPGVKRLFIGSGVRYDLLLHRGRDEEANRHAEEYTRELIAHHVSGRLKVAPEHTSGRVLEVMRKPSFALFDEFRRIFDRICREEGLRQQLIPYFISSHPGCREEDMAELAVLTRRMDFHLEQVQDFTPTPMTLATEAWYTGYHPYTLEPVFCARSPREKLAQRRFFFWYKPEERGEIVRELRRIGRADLIDGLYGGRSRVASQSVSAPTKTRR